MARNHLDEAVVSALESERASQLPREVLESPALELLLTEAVESRLSAELTDRVLERVGEPALREAVAAQSASLADEAAMAVSSARGSRRCRGRAGPAAVARARAEGGGGAWCAISGP